MSDDSDGKSTALGMLLDATGAVGQLVRDYATRNATEEDWLDSWFLRRTELHCESRIPEDEQFVPITIEPIDAPLLNQSTGLRIVSVRPNYFRGFKEIHDPIDLTGDLIVIEGKNSSGKTSLAEALEFLFTRILVASGRTRRRQS